MWPSTSSHGYSKSWAPSAASSSIELDTRGCSLTRTHDGRKNTEILSCPERMSLLKSERLIQALLHGFSQVEVRPAGGYSCTPWASFSFPKRHPLLCDNRHEH